MLSNYWAGDGEYHLYPLIIIIGKFTIYEYFFPFVDTATEEIVLIVYI